MGFVADTPLVAGTILLRSAIQSPDYVASTTGWAIKQDGSCDLNNVSVRGTFRTANTVIDDTGVTITGSQQQLQMIGTGVTVTGIPPDGGSVSLADAAGFGGTVFLKPITSNVPGVVFSQALLFATRDEVAVLPTTTRPTVTLRSPIVNGGFASSRIDVRAQASGSATDDGFIELHATSILKNGIDIGGGWVAGDVIIAPNAGVTGAGVETVQLTALDASGATPTYRAGRVYRVEVAGNTSTTSITAAAPNYAVKKTSAAGQQFSFWRVSCATTGTAYVSKSTCYFQVGATDVAANIVVTLAGVAAQTVTCLGAVTAPHTFNIYEDGAASTQRVNLPILV